MSNNILDQTTTLAEYMYSKLDEFPEEERWHTANKIRTASNDLLFYVAQATGSSTPAGPDYEWGSASKHLEALKTLYRFAGRQGFIKIEPEIMLKIDSISEMIQQELVKSNLKTESASKKDMDDWLKRYKIWNETKL